MSTDNLSFLNDSAMLSALDVMELFGRGYQLNFSLKDGFYVSDERVSCMVGNESFIVHIIKSDVLRSVLFLDKSEFPAVGASLHHHEKIIAVEISGPSGKINREIPVYSIKPMIWVKNKPETGFAELFIVNHHSEHRFNGVQLVEATVESDNIILPQSWKKLLGASVHITVKMLTDFGSHTAKTSLLTEQDVRSAILAKRKIKITPNRKITPAALELGNANHIFIK